MLFLALILTSLICRKSQIYLVFIYVDISADYFQLSIIVAFPCIFPIYLLNTICILKIAIPSSLKGFFKSINLNSRVMER